MSKAEKIINFIGGLLLIYAFLFLLCFGLYMDCTQTYSADACKDNLLTEIVIAPINAFK